MLLSVKRVISFFFIVLAVLLILPPSDGFSQSNLKKCSKDQSQRYQQAQKNLLGAAILGGIVGGIVAGSIHRCHSHGGCRHCHNHTGGHNHYRSGIFYAPAPPPVYAPVPVNPAPVGYPTEHYKWCYNRYNSYHQPSNTYQPYRKCTEKSMPLSIGLIWNGQKHG